MKKAFALLAVIIVILTALYFAHSEGFLDEFFGVVLLNESELTEYSVPESGKGTGFFRHGYEELDETSKQAYALILQSIEAHPERIRVPKLNSEQLSDVFSALSYDNPEMLCLGNDCKLINRGRKYYFVPTYSASVEVCRERTSHLEEAVEQIGAYTAELDDEYEKEKYVHDLIIANCEYTPDTGSPHANSAYGALVMGEAACEGYSRAFQLVMSKNDIDSRLVTGKAFDENENTIGHMWNAVVIDGENYFVDLTWNDPILGENIIGYAYFNVTEDMIKSTHTEIEPQISCTATENNYFVRENLYFTDTGQYFENRVKSAVGYAYSQGRESVEFRFSNRDTYERAKGKLTGGTLIREAYQLCGLISKDSGFTVNYSENISALTFRLYLKV